MQSRIAFTSGEFSPEVSVRSDLEQYTRGCSSLLNWDVTQTGGVKRRKGMVNFANLGNITTTSALGCSWHIVPYIYSYEEGRNLRFLVALGAQYVKVYSVSGANSGECVASFDWTSIVGQWVPPKACHHYQVNRLLFITSSEVSPMVLEYDGEEWSFKKWEFKYYPYRYNHEDRDNAVHLTKSSDGTISVDFSDVEDESEKIPEHDDILQLSYYIEQQTAFSTKQATLDKSKIGALIRHPYFVKDYTTSSLVASKGMYIATIEDEETCKYYVCTTDWYYGNSYRAGLESPANYTSNFVECQEPEDSTKLLAEGYSMKNIWENIKAKESGRTHIISGEVVKIKDQKITLYTWNGGGSIPSWYSIENIKKYSIKGVAIGDAVTCKGSWSVQVSGVWYGEYEVRRNYETSDNLDADWEGRGTTSSEKFATANNILSGSEEEECYLRLYLNKISCSALSDFFTVSSKGSKTWESGYMSDKHLVLFPSDSCHNRLVVNQYKHDEVLKYDSENQEWSKVGDIDTGAISKKKIWDWSWCAFSERYGYPMHACVFDGRLVFAATDAQPQTVWFSQPNDLNNFATSSTDASAIWVTFNTTSQDSICWINDQNNQLICGTASEICGVTNPRNQLLTASTAQRVHHSSVGSSHAPCLMTSDKTLYVGRGGWRVHQFSYSVDADGLVSSDISLLASHIGQTHGGFKAAAIAEKPDTVAYYVMGDGTMALCTYNAAQNVKAWHRWSTQGTIEDVCVLPNGDKADRVFLVVKRGNEKHIEVIDEDSPYKDCGTLDYTSEIITNDLTNPMQEVATKRVIPSIALFFGDTVQLSDGNVKVSGGDCDTWYDINCADDTISKGWNDKFITDSGNRFARKAGIRVSGNMAFNLLAIQG